MIKIHNLKMHSESKEVDKDGSPRKTLLNGIENLVGRPGVEICS